MRKILCSVLALLMLLSAFSCLTITGLAADTTLTEIEDNNSAATATEFKAAETITGAMNKASDVDWYKIESNGDYFSFDFGLTTSSDPDMIRYGWKVTLYDSSIREIDNYVTTGVFSTHPIPRNGIIYIKVESKISEFAEYAPNGVAYTLRVDVVTDEKWENESNDSASSANLLKLNQSNIGALQESDDIDWYKFTCDKEKSDYFTLDFNLLNITDKTYINFGWKVTLYDSSMDSIILYEDVTTINSPKFPITGEIYIKVESYYTSSGNSPVNIPYTLTAKTFTDSQWESEYNNDSTKANKIEQGKNYKATLHTGTDVDFFKFTAPTAAFKIKFNVNLNETSVDSIKYGWKMTIFPSNSSTSIVADYTIDSTGSFETITLPYESGQEYFIKIESYYTSDVNAPVNAIYNLEIVDATDGKKWEKENGRNAFEYATSINENQIVYGNLYSSSDYDHYKISVPADGVVYIDFAREEDDRVGEGWKLCLKDAAGNIVYSEDIKNTLTNAPKAINVKKGNYYLVVNSCNSNAPSSEIEYNINYNYIQTPKITKVSNAANGIKIEWNKTTGVTSYILYRKEYNAKTKKWSGWKQISKPSVSATSYIDTTAKSGVKYKYTIKGYEGNLASGIVSSSTLLRLAQPKTTVKAVSSGINVAWTQSAGATGYTIYRSEYNSKTKKWSGWNKMGTLKSNKKSWIDKSAKKGVVYRYTVKAVNGKTASTYAASGTVKR